MKGPKSVSVSGFDDILILIHSNLLVSVTGWCVYMRISLLAVAVTDSAGDRSGGSHG